jgi:hypothetical protein
MDCSENLGSYIINCSLIGMSFSLQSSILAKNLSPQNHFNMKQSQKYTKYNIILKIRCEW